MQRVSCRWRPDSNPDVSGKAGAVHLVTAETELKGLQRRAANDALPTVDAVLEIYRSMLLRISDALAQDVERARAALAQVLGTVTVRGTDEGLWAEVETRPEAVLLSAGGALSLGLVAGTCNRTRLHVTCAAGR
jgi:hypothetical protein